MNHGDGQLITGAIKFAARFGFLTRDIFFSYLCDGSRAHKYRKWNLLLGERWFVPSFSNPYTVYLSRKSKKIFSLNDIKARSPLFIAHDQLVAEFLLTFEKTGLLVGSWTEMELSRQRWNSFSTLGTDQVGKIPDLILDLKTYNGSLRVAIEIELSRKSRKRYAHIALSYLEMKRIDLVIYACSREQITADIKQSFAGKIFNDTQKQPATILIPDFSQKKLNAPLSYLEKNYTIKNFLEAATKIPIKVVGAGEKAETVVSENLKEALC